MTSAGRILILGAGEAGVAAAGALREGGYGGRVSLVHDEPRTPYERPPLSKAMLLQGVSGARLIRPPEWYAEQGIELIGGSRVIDIDPSSRIATLEADGARSQLSFDKLLFANGARPRRLANATENTVYLRTFADWEILQAKLQSLGSVVVVGGGVIGLEVASALRSLGKAVTVLDIADRLMARAVTPEVSDFLLSAHLRNGVDVRLEQAFRLTPRGVELADGEHLDADLILVAIGVVPNTELAEALGCAVDNGVLVDHCGRTTVEGVFAAGDVARFLHPTFDRLVRVEAWQHAGRHGAHVGRAMMGVDDGYQEIPWFWTDQYDFNLQVVGSVEGVSSTLWRVEGGGRTALHFAGDRLIGATTIDNGRDIRPLTKLISGAWRGDPSVLCDTARPLGRLSRDLLAAA